MNSIKIKLIIECILFAGSIAIAILTHNSEKVPKKNRQWIVGVSFIIAFATFSGSFLINQIPEPIIDRAADYSKIILSTDEKMTIEYRMSTNGDSSNDWIKYDGPFKLEKNAVIYARAKTLFYKSNPVYRDVYVSEGKLVYFGLADKPGDTIIDITASYNYKEAVKNKSASNHYDGYTIKKEDIHITGRDMNDNEKEIKDFTYSPKMIKDGENIITIEYPITSDYTLQTKLKVIGNEPTLIRLNAEFIGRTLFIDTPLDNNYFVVYGVYEDGTSQVVDGYMISSTTIKEGDNRITITKDGLSTMLEITGVDRETITENESEPNNEIKTANEIDANVKYSGTIRDTDDVDYYKLRLKEKGSIKILFAHPKIDEDGDFWSVSLLSKEETVRVGINVKGKDVETTSSRARVTPGDYYVKVSKQRFSNEKYTMTLLFEHEDESYETEPNDNLTDQAMTINLDKTYTGNLTNDDDIDYYKFSIQEKRKVSVAFTHDKTSGSDTYWNVTLFGDSDGSILEFNSSGETASILSDSVRLPAGNYYIKVKDYRWSDIDYTFCVNSEKEGNETENEDNGDYSTATKMSLNSSIRGNIQSDRDIDFYSFVLKSSSSITISFSHRLRDSNDTFWRIELYSAESSNAIRTDDDYSTISINGDSSESILSKWSSLSPGTYYIKVFSYQYDNEDYLISLKM